MATFLVVREPLLLVTRRDTLAVRHNPDLQEVHRFCLRVIELTVADTGTRGHDLHVTRSDDRSGTDAVLVPVSVGAEPLSRADSIFVDHPQRAKPNVLRVVIVAERERVPAIEPA